MRNDMCMLIVTIILLLNVSTSKSRQFEGSNGILKTIKTDVDIIDCVNIYKQPAFSHPSLVNHTIQKGSTFSWPVEPDHALTYSSKLTSKAGKVGVEQPWHEYGECPKGSIPIVRTQMGTQRKLAPFSSNDPQFQHQYAAVRVEKPGRIHGGHANINNWSPYVNRESTSISQLWIVAGNENDLNTMEVGWQMNPNTGSSRPRIFIYWTIDNYKNTGCYNLDCPGFVQTSQKLPVNPLLGDISVYGGTQFDISYDIRKDKNTGNWWVTLNGIAVGYWPAKIFTRMSESADYIVWGGEVADRVTSINKSPTQMGNGHFPRESYTKSSYIREIKYVNPSGNDVYLGMYEFIHQVTDKSCYDLTIEKRRELYVFYGGPGCRK